MHPRHLTLAAGLVLLGVAVACHWTATPGTEVPPEVSPVPGRVVVIGRVVDSAGVPIPGRRIRPNGHGFGSPTDAQGRFRDSRRLVPVTLIDVLCPDGRRGTTVRLLRPLAATGNPADTLRDVGDLVVPRTTCDGAPVAANREFRGRYSGGFEHSSFVPCPSSLPDGARWDGRQIWAHFAPGLLERMGARWPPPAPRANEDSGAYLRVRGKLWGPGIYGHLGLTAYELEIDSILEVRRPKRGECLAPGT